MNIDNTSFFGDFDFHFSLIDVMKNNLFKENQNIKNSFLFATQKVNKIYKNYN